jgi:hypothetical protein
MLWIESANFLKHSIPVQNEQGDVKLGVSHMELFTKYENKKSWLWQSQIFTENLNIGRIDYKIAEHLEKDAHSAALHSHLSSWALDSPI